MSIDQQACVVADHDATNRDLAVMLETLAALDGITGKEQMHLLERANSTSRS